MCKLMAAVMAAALLAVAQPGLGAAATETTQDPARSYAEGLAEAASKEFSAILERQRLAQAQGPKTDTGVAAKPSDQGAGPPLNWFQRASREFQTLMGMLAGGQPPSRSWDPVADAEKKAAASMPKPQKADASQAQPPAKASPPPAADAKKPTEERRLAETRRAEADTRADAKKAEDAAKTEPAKRVTDKAAENARRIAEAKRAAEAEAALHAARAAEVRRAAAAKTAVDAAQAAEVRRQQAKAAAEARKTAAVTKAPETKRVADARAAAGPGPRKAIRMAERRRHAAVATCRAAGRPVRLPGWYVVRRGDTLSVIARRHYGTAQGYRRIRAANRRAIPSADRIYPCQRIYLPRAVRRG